MIFFQWISIPIILLLAARSGLKVIRGEGVRWLHVVGTMVWVVSAIAIAMPDSTNTIARALGIGRGADLLTYLLAIAYMATTFYFYHRNRQLTVDITSLTRHLALISASQPALRANVEQGEEANKGPIAE